MNRKTSNSRDAKGSEMAKITRNKAKKPTAKQIADALHLSVSRYYRLKREIAPLGTESIDDILKNYIAYLREAATGTPTLHGVIGDIDIDHERARVAKASADKLELDIKYLRRRLLPTEKVRSAWNSMVAVMRTKTAALPDALLPKLKAAGSYAEAEQTFKTGVNALLNELADLDPDVVARSTA